METQFNPKVSIIIPVYNGTDYMREAIDSALAQTYQNIEVIVVNDGSKDDGATRKVAVSYGEKIRYFEKENGGVASALNLGLEKMTGEYFSWLSHDDMYLPKKVEVQVNHLKNLSDKNTVLYGGWLTINEHSTITAINDLSLNHSERNLNKPLYPLLNGIIHGCALLVPRECFLTFGKFDESLKTTQDYHLWYKMLKKYPVFFHKEILIKYRIHEKQGSVADSKYLKEANNLWISFLNDINDDIIDRFSYNYELYVYRLAKHLRVSQCQDAYKAAADKYKNIKHDVEISIILPTYNRSYCLSDAIDSILEQTFNNYEIIVVDDGSDDNTEDVLKKYNTRIKYYRQENKGVSAARNLGIQKASGKYIAFIDSDDLWTKSHLSKHFTLLENNLDYAMTYNLSVPRDFHTNRKIGNRKKSIHPKEIGYPDTLFISKNDITTPSVVIRKCILDETGLFDEKMDMCEDLDLWRRISMTFKIGCISQCLTTIRVRENQFDAANYLLKRKLFLEKAMSEDKNLPNKIISSLFYELYITYYPYIDNKNLITDDITDYLIKIPELSYLLLHLDNNSGFQKNKIILQPETQAELKKILYVLLGTRLFRAIIYRIVIPLFKSLIKFNLFIKKIKFIK